MFSIESKLPARRINDSGEGGQRPKWRLGRVPKNWRETLLNVVSNELNSVKKLLIAGFNPYLANCVRNFLEKAKEPTLNWFLCHAIKTIRGGLCTLQDL